MWRALQGKCKQTVIHSGQHYDDNMSKQIIEDTGCHIDIKLKGGPERRRARLFNVLELLHPDLVIVYGDCDTTAEGAAVARDLGVKIAHVEAGLRCGDTRMREERNRTFVDHISDWLYAPSADAEYNLLQEMCKPRQIEMVGNVMADSYHWACSKYDVHKTAGYGYGLVTMHRPENVDDFNFLSDFMISLQDLCYPILLPKHPRVTLPFVPRNVRVVDPVSYKDMLVHLNSARFIITDSGGLQEEATLAGIPCLTMRPSTERPITITEGTNELSSLHRLYDQVLRIRGGYPNNPWKTGSIPFLWDGKAGERIAAHLERTL